VNICLVNPTRRLQPGLKGIAKALASRRHNVTVLTPRLPTQEDDFQSSQSIRVETYPAAFVPRIRYTIPSFIGQLRVLRRAFNSDVDVICLYKYFYPVAWVPLLYAKVCRIPVLLITDSFPGISWKYGSRFVDLVASAYSKSVGRLILRLSDRVIIFSPSLLKPARQLGVNDGKLSVVAKGVDFDRFGGHFESLEVKRSLGISDDEAMILSVGRLAPVKGVETLIRITERLVEEGRNVKVVVAGDGPYRDEYERMAAKVRGNVVFAGFRSDIPQLLAACDVFVLPSLSEGLPSALLEAAACGKPLVASNTGAIPDVVIHGETGFLAEPGDVESFARHIKLLLDDAEKAARFGARAREHVRRDFDWDAIASRYEDLCVQAIQTKKASR